MRKKQVVGMLLAMSMSIALLPAEAWAAKGNSRQEATTEVVGQEDVDNQSHRLETTSDGQIVDGTDKWETFQIPDIIEKGEVKEKGYIGRAFESEKDLNTFVFQNSDGSNTMRIYDYPVKYVDENGDIRDITTDIRKCADGAYVTKENTIKTRFPKYIREGITLSSDDVNIQLMPNGKDNATKYATNHISVRNIDNKTVSYQYGTNTTLEYELTYTGFKEDIVVSEYTGQTEYEFTIHTNGLYLSEEEGSYYLVDDEGTVQATIGDIIIFTADEANNTMGSMTSVTIKDGQEYLLTIHVDGEYLRDEKTVYPIRIDPTIEVNYDNNGAGAIEDVTLNEKSGSSGSSGSLYIGKRSTYGISRVLMKFPKLDLSNISSPGDVISATVELRDLLCQTTAATIQCYVYKGVAWSESKANWSNVTSGGYTTLLSSNSVSYANGTKQSTAHRYKFDIKNAVENWVSDTAKQDMGIMFKADSTVENGSTYNYKTFASYNRASYKPSLSITYNGFDGAQTIALNEVKNVQIKYAEEKKYFKFIPQSTGFYSFTSSNSQSTYPCAWLYNVDEKQLSYNGYVPEGKNCRITYHLVEGKVYYFVAGYCGIGTGNYNVQIVQCNSYVTTNFSEIKWDNELKPVCNYKQKAVCYKYIPEETIEHLIYSSDAEGDPRIRIYNANMQLINENDNGAAYYNFRVSVRLSKGCTYYIVVDQNGSKVGKVTLNILKDATGLTGSYYIKNVGNLKYVDIEGPTTQEWVHQWDAHLDMQEKWSLVRLADGYYAIRSEYGKKYYIGVESTTTTTDNIKLYSAISDNTKWKIYKSKSEEMVLEPKTAAGKILYAPNNATGAQLQLINYSYKSSDRDKWKIQEVGDYVSKINSYFDSGFTVFYGYTSEESIEMINACMEEVCEKYYELFKLRILYDSAEYYKSAIDTCKGTTSSANIDTLCSHSGDSHTQLENVLLNFESDYPGSNIHSNILWTCHLINTPAFEGDTTTNRSHARRNIVLMFDRNEGINIQSRLAKTLMHELAHQFGAKDHYHDEDENGKCRNEAICTQCKPDQRPEECIMFNPDCNVICKDCKDDIISHLNSHHKK